MIVSSHALPYLGAYDEMVIHLDLSLQILLAVTVARDMDYYSSQRTVRGYDE
jgi:hypothetical protein